jgi:hypothetical protein
MNFYVCPDERLSLHELNERGTIASINQTGMHTQTRYKCSTIRNTDMLTIPPVHCAKL